MKILFIAPLPPPVTGQSLASKVLLDELIKLHSVEVLNFNKDSFKSGVNSFKRIFQIANFIRLVWLKKNAADIIYFSISESFAGNLKDLLIYLICIKKPRQMIIHLLGGAGIKIFVDKKGAQYKLNKLFVSRLKAVVVEGKVQSNAFSKLISLEKIHIVPNFAENYLFTTRDEIAAKFADIVPLRVLFLSYLLPGKGHNELLEAFFKLDLEKRDMLTIDFAGGFESDNDKQNFLYRISTYKQIQYHGIVHGEEKRKLFSRAHVFCLPTYYSYEGQPISILEAYASGCAVITTNHSGIPDIFRDNINGYEVRKRSVIDLKNKLIKVLDNKNNIFNFALINYEHANKFYRVSNYNSKLMSIFNSHVLV